MKPSTVLAVFLGIVPAFAFPSLLRRKPLPQGSFTGSNDQNDATCAAAVAGDSECDCGGDSIAFCTVTDDAAGDIQNGPDETDDPQCPITWTPQCKSGSCWLDQDCSFFAVSEACICVGSGFFTQGTCYEQFQIGGRDLQEHGARESAANSSSSSALTKRLEQVVQVADPMMSALQVLGAVNLQAATTMIGTKFGPNGKGKYLVGLSGKLAANIVIGSVTYAIGQAWTLRHDYDPSKGYHVNLAVGSRDASKFAYQQTGMTVEEGTQAFIKVAHITSLAVAWIWNRGSAGQCFGGKFNQVAALATTIARWVNYLNTGAYA